jgi:acetyl esterase/lipase
MKKILGLSLLTLALLTGCINNTTTTSSQKGSSTTKEPSLTSKKTTTASTTTSSKEHPYKPKNVTAYYDLSYAGDDNIITNSYGEKGKNFRHPLNVNNGQDYAFTKANTFDLYVPDSLQDKKQETIGVLLMIHGGAWLSGTRDDSYMYNAAQVFLDSGYIVANMDYTLFDMENDFLTANPSHSIYRMLDEIDECISATKEKLVDLGFDGSKLELGLNGYSAGAHLAMLYGYSRPSDSDLPVKLIVEEVGPVEVSLKAWKQFKDASLRSENITPEDIASQEALGNLEQLVFTGEVFGSDSPNIRFEANESTLAFITNAFNGSPYAYDQIRSLFDDGTPESSFEKANLDSNQKELLTTFAPFVSPTNFIDKNSVPTLMAYGGQDTIVGISQYATLKSVLDEKNVANDFVYFKNSGHSLDDQRDSLNLLSLKNKINIWCSTYFGA